MRHTGSRWLRTLTVAVACALVSASCGSGSSVEPGPVGGSAPLTRIPPESRTVAPVATGTQLGAEQRQLSTGPHPGKVVVINVWASWCTPCRKEAADLQQASHDTSSMARFVGITTGERDPAAPLAFTRNHEIDYPSIFDPNGTAVVSFAGSLPLTTPPSTLVIDPQGRIAARITGATTRSALVQLIEETAAGR